MSCPKKCGPSRSLFYQYTAPGGGGGCNYHTSFALGTVQVQESGGREASSDQSNTDAPYLTHQHCWHERQKLCNTSPMSIAPRGNERMLAGDEYVPVRCLYTPAPVAVLELIKCGCKTSCKCHLSFQIITHV